MHFLSVLPLCARGVGHTQDTLANEHCLHAQTGLAVTSCLNLQRRIISVAIKRCEQIETSALFCTVQAIPFF